MNKKIINTALAGLMIAGVTSFTAFASMPNGTVAIGGKAFDLGYANDPANLGVINKAVVASSKVYVKGFNGIWINNQTSEPVNASIIPSVVYKSATKEMIYDAADVDHLANIAVESVSAVNNVNVVYGTTVANVGLPGKVTLKLSNNSNTDVQVSWTSSNYDRTKTATYVFTGIYTLPEGVTGTMPVVTANVIVGERVLAAVVSKGNNSVVSSMYDVTLENFIEQEMKRTPAASIDGQWRYAFIKNGQPGYCTDIQNPNDSWVNSPTDYNKIRDQLIYNIDPLNLENDPYKIYEFVKLNYLECITASELNLMFGTRGILNGKGQLFIDAAKANNINPVYLAAHAILETAYGTSALANGGKKDSTGKYIYGIPVYNLFGIGAIDSDPDATGTKKAYDQGWTSIELAINGGAKWISNGYIANNQDTLYKMRWNPINIAHQYATDVNWANSQISIMKIKDCFDLFADAPLVFDIPVYK